ncbi:sialate O-acetylesterase [Confluentibacter sediminis]|uniref:sialate O-acetylesterase n=1 Tax=Confluentibacter sediminis TaxID=2219045 RepID=UPI000DAEBE3B|nr:sialate O-acetylesterase [Confluentibacter sediminis]
MKKVPILFFVFILSFCSNKTKKNLNKELTVSSLFKDHMVLQQLDNITIWGESDPYQVITITPSWQNDTDLKVNSVDEVDVDVKSTDVFSGKAQSDGKWRIKIPTPKAGGPYSIKISTTEESIKINDVMIGEVWLASGQSNMDMPLKGWMPNDSINDSANTIANAKNPSIRFFKVPFGLSTKPQDSIAGEWVTSSPETAKDFSATAYFFAKKLQQELNVPIGIIQSAVGGTPAEAWTSKNTLKEFSDFNKTIDEISGMESKTKTWFKNRKTQPIPQTTESWKDISFNDVSVSKADFNDVNWEIISLPGRFDIINDNQFDGAMWFRKKFTIEDISEDYILKIGAVDDMDATYINGEYVGGLVGTGNHNILRVYTIPKSILKVGENTIAIRGIDTGGPGVISGPITLETKTMASPISLEGKWKSKLIADIYNGQFVSYDLNTDMSKHPDTGNLNSGSPTVLYNAMINPLMSYTIKGAIWYQGESNVSRPEQYKKLFPAMINDWRTQWKYDFPFYFVQIAPYTYNGDEQNKSQKLRDAQRMALKTKKTGMVVTLDIGSEFNIHPSEKQEIGNRLAGLALANDYGKDLVASGPLFKNVKTDGNKLIVSFESVGKGLMTDKNGLSNFEIAGVDKKYMPAHAKIVNETVVVSNSNISNPVYVRYGWSDTATATLFNKEGLPASTFTSEKE